MGFGARSEGLIAGSLPSTIAVVPKHQRLVALDWLTETSVNISDVLYKVTDAGKAAALRDD